MPYNIRDRLDILGNRFNKWNAQEITYTAVISGTTHGATFIASPGLSVIEELVPGVSITQIKYLDWFFDLDKLVLNGSPYIPEMGNRITDGVRTFKVVPLRDNDPPFQYVTHSYKRVMVHTERIAG